MKHAYVSVVISTGSAMSNRAVEAIDETLQSLAQLHEIILVVPNDRAGEGEAENPRCRGPVTVVRTDPLASDDAALLAGLGRAVGDFVIDWRGPLESLDAGILRELLTPSEAGCEIVEIRGVDPSLGNRLITRAVNWLRPRGVPVQGTLGRSFSRRALNCLLDSAPREPELAVVVAELPLPRREIHTRIALTHRMALTDRILYELHDFLRGRRLASVAAAVLVSTALLGIVTTAVAGVALTLLDGGRDRTFVAVCIGLTQVVTLIVASSIWARVDRISRMMTTTRDSTTEVSVLPPDLA